MDKWEITYTARCFTQYKKILLIDHEPTEAYIEACFKSAPQYNSRFHKVEHDSADGLWKLTMYASLDTGD